MTNPTTQAWIDSTVAAEDAPIGVQVWPTTDPRYSLNFTIERVEIIRNARGTHVRWVYENGSERVFDLGERVVVRTFRPIRPGAKMIIPGSNYMHWGLDELTACDLPGSPAAPGAHGAWCTTCGIAAGEVERGEG